jgi:hypothetical protein
MPNHTTGGQDVFFDRIAKRGYRRSPFAGVLYVARQRPDGQWLSVRRCMKIRTMPNITQAIPKDVLPACAIM